MSRKRIGVALGAGSTKGFAHIGVLQVLEENNIPVDMIAGCSIGSIIAGIYAAGSDMKLLGAFASQMDMKEYLDVANPKHGGMIRGEKLEELIGLFTHHLSYGQTKIPFYCTATDACEGTQKVFDEGPISRSIRASMSIPGIFSPVEIDGHLYVDGGVLERIPCTILREKGADVIIAVDVGYHGIPMDVTGFNAYEMINHSVDMMTWEISKRQRLDADVLLTPEVLFVKGHFDTASAREIINEGRRVAEAALPEIRRRMEEPALLPE